MHVTLRANERIYINGAVLRVDRKTSIELLNDAVFLLEAHVMQEREANTPLRQLYYVVQLMLMAPHEIAENRDMFARQHAALTAIYGESLVLAGLARVADLVARRRYFEALKTVRTLLPAEDRVLAPTEPELRQAS